LGLVGDVVRPEAAKAGGAGGIGAFVPAVVVLALAIAAYFFLNKA